MREKGGEWCSVFNNFLNDLDEYRHSWFWDLPSIHKSVDYQVPESALHIPVSASEDSANHGSCCTKLKKNLPVRAPSELKPVLFAGQLY